MDMRKLMCLLGVLLLLPLVAGAEEGEEEERPPSDHWKRTVTFDFTTTQAAYSDSWVGGEAGSVNWVTNLNGRAERQLKPWLDYRTILKLSFGQTHTQDEETKHWSRPRKSTDLIDWEHLGKFTFGGFVDPYAAFHLESQFYDGSVREKKRYFSPLRLTESAGIAKKLYEKEDDNILSRVGLALRQVRKSAIIDSTTLATEDSVTTDGGFESVTDAVLTLSDKLLYVSKLTLYKALYFSESDKVKGTEYEDYWKAVDVNWENIITAQLSKVVAVILYTQFLYDKEVTKKGRVKETMALGFVFKLQ